MRAKTDFYTAIEVTAYVLYTLGCLAVFGYVAYGILDFGSIGSAVASVFFTLLIGLLVTLGAAIVLAPASFILSFILVGAWRIAQPKH